MNIHSTVKLRTGSSMPIIALGSWELNKDTADAVLAALSNGYRMIDTSGDYGTQPGIGKGIKQSGIPRREIYLVTKVEENDDAYEAAKKNLRELQTAYADLMLIHRPPQTGAGEELWQGLIRAKKDGLTRDIGVSNYTIDQLDELIEASGETPVVNQIEWSPFGQSQEMSDYCRSKNIIIQAYSPLTRGERLDDERLTEIARKYSVPPAQSLIRWNLQNGTVPLLKANHTEHQKENLDVFGFEISDEDMEELQTFNEQYSALGRKLQYV
jgi:diketogulonate reductase-like aldo/keto reductase